MPSYSIKYKLLHSNGSLVDESGDSIFEFKIGDGQLDRCLEVCVEQAKVGQLQTFLLSSDESFGPIKDEAIQVMNRSEFLPDMLIQENVAVEFKTPTGDSYVGCIEKIDGDSITVNFNHPLAGCDVSFQVQVISVSD
jgi:FKBP-type peptidyl-prolyl cis-trans isomerase 2